MPIALDARVSIAYVMDKMGPNLVGDVRGGSLVMSASAHEARSAAEAQSAVLSEEFPAFGDREFAPTSRSITKIEVDKQALVTPLVET